jgi:hypothetical protein
MKEMKFIGDGFKHRQGELIVFPTGEYRVLQGAILKRVVTQRNLLNDEYEAISLYGVGDVISVDDRSQACDYKCMNLVSLEKIKSIEDINLLPQLKKQEDLCYAVAKKRSHSTPGIEDDIRDNKVYSVLSWIDRYFKNQTFIITHADIGSLCLLSRGSITLTLNKFYNLGLISNSRIKKVSGINLIKGAN